MDNKSINNIPTLVKEWLNSEASKTLHITYETYIDHTLSIDKRVLVKLYSDDLFIFNERNKMMESSSQHSVLFIIGKIVSLPMDTYFEANKANEKNYRIQIQLSNSSFAVVGVSIQQIYNYEKIIKADPQLSLSIGQYLLVPHKVYNAKEVFITCRIEKLEYHDNQITSIEVTNLEVPSNNNDIDMFADEYLVLDTLKSKSRNLIKLDLQNVRNNSNEALLPDGILLYPTHQEQYYPVQIQSAIKNALLSSASEGAIGHSIFEQPADDLTEQILNLSSIYCKSFQKLHSEISAEYGTEVTGLLARDNLEIYSRLVATSDQNILPGISRTSSKTPFQDTIFALRFRNLCHSLHNLIFVYISYEKLFSSTINNNHKGGKQTSQGYCPGQFAVNNNILSELLESEMIPLIRVLPVPYRISISDWFATSHCLRLVINIYKQLLLYQSNRLLLLQNEQKDASVMDPSLAATNNHSDSLLAKFLIRYHQYQQNGYQAITNFYQLSMCDAIIRNDWTSNSPYLRNKKISYGTISMITSMRQLIWSIYHFNCSSYNEDVCLQSFNKNTTAISTNNLINTNATTITATINRSTLDYSNAFRDSLQVLLNTLTPLMHTYYALKTSRIRLGQWNIDQYYILFMAFDTLLWILHQEQLKYQTLKYKYHTTTTATTTKTNDSNSNPNPNLNSIKQFPSSFKELFGKDNGNMKMYIVGIEIFHEVLLVLTNISFYLYLINNPVDEILEQLLLLSSSSTSLPITTSILADKDDVNVMNDMIALQQIFSWSFLFHSKNQSLLHDIDSYGNEHLHTMIEPNNNQRRSTSIDDYDINRDILCYQGYLLSNFHFDFENNNNNNTNNNNNNNNNTVDEASRKDFIFQELMNTRIVNNNPLLFVSFHQELLKQLPNNNRYILIDENDIDNSDIDIENDVNDPDLVYENVPDLTDTTSRFNTTSSINQYIVNCLNKRYECLNEAYPVLTNIEIENNQKMKQFIETMVI